MTPAELDRLKAATYFQGLRAPMKSDDALSLVRVGDIRAVITSLERAREALKPFAQALHEWGDDPEQERRDIWEHPLSMLVGLSDFRAARQALAEEPTADHSGIVQMEDDR